MAFSSIVEWPIDQMIGGLRYLLERLAALCTDLDQLTINDIALFVMLLCICIVFTRLLKPLQWINTYITALFIGLGVGIAVLFLTNGRSSRFLQFDEELFFIYLLPPIIFNAGFQVKKKQFFRNFMIIMSFGALGTMISFCIISYGAKMLFETLDLGYLELRDYLVIGAIFSATDSVSTLQVLDQDQTPLLYSLVFGEGVVNDATSIVLFNAIQNINLETASALKFMGSFFSLFVTSSLLGVSIGLLSAYITKKLYSSKSKNPTGRESEVAAGHEDEVDGHKGELALMILMPYLAYLTPELFGWSGILAVFFCGIVMSHYTLRNVSKSSKVAARHAFLAFSLIAEMLIFCYVGMDAIDISKWKIVSISPGKAAGASAALLGLVAVGRASFVFPLSILSNFLVNSKHDRLNFKQQVIIWWAGMMRGAVSVALAYNQFAKSGHTEQPGNAVTITCTITVVLFSTVVMGMLTRPIVSLLRPPADQAPSEPSSPTSMTLPLLQSHLPESKHGPTSIRDVTRTGSLRMLLATPTNTVHYYWRLFDRAYMRPIFRVEEYEEHQNASSPEQLV